MTPPVPVPPRRPLQRARPDVAGNVLTLGQIRIHPGSVTKEQALAEAADILEAAGAVTPGYYDAMQQREQAVSTYMGNGLAVPHGTNETKQMILASAVSVVRYDGGIDWDGEPVTFVIGMAGKCNDHLTILSHIALIFSDFATVDALTEADTPEQILPLLETINS